MAGRPKLEGDRRQVGIQLTKEQIEWLDRQGNRSHLMRLLIDQARSGGAVTVQMLDEVTRGIGDLRLDLDQASDRLSEMYATLTTRQTDES